MTVKAGTPTGSPGRKAPDARPHRGPAVSTEEPGEGRGGCGRGRAEWRQWVQTARGIFWNGKGEGVSTWREGSKRWAFPLDTGFEGTTWPRRWPRAGGREHHAAERARRGLRPAGSGPAERQSLRPDPRLPGLALSPLRAPLLVPCDREPERAAFEGRVNKPLPR